MPSGFDVIENHSMTALPRLCVTLKATEAGGYLSRHLTAIRQAIDGTDKQISLDDLGGVRGECRLSLPVHYCEIRAQALADRLNGLSDNRGRPLIDAQVSYQIR